MLHEVRVWYDTTMPLARLQKIVFHELNAQFLYSLITSGSVSTVICDLVHALVRDPLTNLGTAIGFRTTCRIA